jgi:exopolyphosphatase/guanosine-5'-triphosphate,3'-diphosphate pyrophosphatase
LQNVPASQRLDPPARAGNQARAAAPIAIIDIGSNSVRLVAYADGGRVPTSLYNEKLLCGLGRGVATTGRLPSDAVERALKALARFRVLCGTMGVGQIKVLATAAARDAANGPAFLMAAAAACGQRIELLTGEREAALSAEGVISGFHHPNGVVGDLGGGSLELVDVRDGAVGTGITLPLGGLALQDLAENAPKKAQKIAREKLERARYLTTLTGRTFYAVGGTWRALARLQMLERGYPLNVMHGYRLMGEEGGFLRLVDRVATSAPKLLGAVSEARRPLLVYGAIVLDEIVRLGQPAEITVSALGVREGVLYEALDPAARRSDPLIEATADLNGLRARDPAHGHDLRSWTDAFMDGAGLTESEDERRYRHAACLLSDTGWRAHPDYRGDQSIALITHASFLAIDHPGRAFLALAISFRYNGLSLDKVDQTLVELAGPTLLAKARLLGALMRVAFPITAAMGGVLPRVPLAIVAGELSLTLPSELAPLASERLTNRLRALAKLLGVEATIVFA